MSDQTDNPYQVTPLPDTPAPTETTGAVTAATREKLGRSAPWLRFLSVMGYIGTGLMVIVAIAMIFVGAGLFNQQGFGAFGPLISLLYFGLAALIFFATRIIGRMSRAAKEYRISGEADKLETVAAGVLGLAKYYGICTIVVLGIYAMVLVVGGGAAIITALGQR